MIDDKGSSESFTYDVVVVGAGVSGINTAYRLQTQAPPGTTYAVLEARGETGGTWDLFRYPGIRSDSDIFTYSFSWNPWPKTDTFASGEEIHHYIRQSAEQAGIYQHIRFRHAVKRANWNSKEAVWDLFTSSGGTGSPEIYRARSIFWCTGYYDYEEPLQSQILGIDNFQGKVIHPQFWPKDYDYTGKDIVIIGSGATAVSIVPAVAQKAKHVTMLQRSPTYIIPQPKSNPFTTTTFAIFPKWIAHWMVQVFWITQYQVLMLMCQNFPGLVRKVIRYANMRHLPPDYAVDLHFKPYYRPWDQRVCASVDGDLFAAIRTGSASVVTDTIQAINGNEMKLSSGQVLHPDIIVTATGLKLRIGGGAKLTIDNKTFDPTTKFMWKNVMLQDLPNTFFAVGSPDISWTLLADCAAVLAVRLMWELKRKDATVVQPYLENPENMTVRPMLGLQSNYVKKAEGTVPKAGTGVWSPRPSYLVDRYIAKWGDIETGLKYE